MNSLFATLGIDAWKPLVTALVLPPVPLLVLVLVGAALLRSRRAAGWLLIVLSVAALWLSASSVSARAIERFVLRVPPALGAQRVAMLKTDTAGAAARAIVVLGGGIEPYAPEYGMSNLGFYSLERLRYGLWLGQETGLPVAFSGGVGWASAQHTAEAEVAARIAAKDFKLPLRWTEDQSRDTRQNAAYSVALMKKSGIRHILLVTHGWHMPRAQRAFEEAARPHGIAVEAAPMGLAQRIDSPALDWLPSGQGMLRVRNALRESLGRLLGA